MPQSLVIQHRSCHLWLNNSNLVDSTSNVHITTDHRLPEDNSLVHLCLLQRKVSLDKICFSDNLVMFRPNSNSNSS